MPRNPNDPFDENDNPEVQQPDWDKNEIAELFSIFPEDVPEIPIIDDPSLKVISAPTHEPNISTTENPSSKISPEEEQAQQDRIRAKEQEIYKLLREDRLQKEAQEQTPKVGIKAKEQEVYKLIQEERLRQEAQKKAKQMEKAATKNLVQNQATAINSKTGPKDSASTGKKIYSGQATTTNAEKQKQLEGVAKPQAEKKRAERTKAYDTARYLNKDQKKAYENLAKQKRDAIERAEHESARPELYKFVGLTSTDTDLGIMKILEEEKEKKAEKNTPKNKSTLTKLSVTNPDTPTTTTSKDKDTTEEHTNKKQRK